MARLRYTGIYADVSGTKTPLALGGALTDVATTVTFNGALKYAGGAAVPTIVSPDYLPVTVVSSSGVVLDAFDITAYTAGATTATVTRNAEGYTAIAHSSGTLLMHGVTAQDITSSGSGGSSVVSGVKLKATSQTVAATTFVPVNWSVEVEDTDGYHSTTTNTSRITIPAGKAGKYIVVARIYKEDGGTNHYICSIAKNGASLEETWTRSNGEYPGMFTVSVLDLVVGDYIETYYYGPGGTINISQRAEFSAHLLSAGGSGGGGGGGATTLDGLLDVDTSTVAPFAGQTLVFDGTQWEPGAEIGAVDTANFVTTFETGLL